MPLSETTGKHVEKYRHFREFLLSNRDALRLLAEMEMLYYSGRSFTTADISYQYENLFGHVGDLVRSLNALTDDRFSVLYVKAKEINSSVTSFLKPAITRQTMAPVVSLQDVFPAAASSVGGKAAHLAVIGRQTEARIPAGFVVTATAYDQFLQANRIDQMVLDELAGLSPGDARLEEVSARLTQLILAANVPEELVAQLLAHYDALEEQTQPGIRVAMRSSAVREDSEASFAGQYRSVLNVPGKHLVAAYKEVVASSFSPRAIAYRQMAGIDITETPMCVLGLAMIEAAAGGVLYTADPSGNDPETMRINAVLGLGEQLVSGISAADTFIVDKATGAFKGYKIAAKTLPLDAGIEGTAEHRVPWQEAQKAALSSIPDHTVLVAKTASPRYAEVMGRISGLITEVGSTMCHLASVAREFGVPMAVNVTDATRTLASGDLITLFAQEESAIYPGILANGKPSGMSTKRRILGSSVHLKMRSVLDCLSPLHLTNPDDPAFRPESCSSLHDIIRFAHEQAIREMFNLSALAQGQSVTVKLSTHIPLTLHLIDLGGGLKPGLSTCDKVTAEEFASKPIKALWRGFSHPGINWSGTVQFADNSFLARLAAAATSEFGPEPGGDSYALIGTGYLNFSAKFGYHFATLDTFCGDEPDHNYLSLQFSGGVGTFYGKTLRVQFLGKVLSELGCAVTLQNDVLEASLNRFSRTETLERLEHIGRLLASSRLLDMAIASQQDVDTLAAEFMSGNYDLLNFKVRAGLPSFYTHLGNWRLTEEDGSPCCLSDGSARINSLSAGVSGLIAKTFGHSYQELLDTLGAYYYFPLAIAKRDAAANADISLLVKPLRGNIDQAGGLVFGLRDIGNYFVLRINALEDNAILFEFVDTKRFERARIKIPVAKEIWHLLRVTVTDNLAACLVNNTSAFAYQAERPIRGHVGLWTKADSAVLFKDLVIDDGKKHHIITK